MKGLEASIVSRKMLQAENPKLRLDTQFQGRSALAAISRIAEMPHFRIADLSGRALKGRSIEYSEDGEFPVVRSGDITNAFQPEFLLRSSAREEAFFLKPNDILISSIGQGSIGKIQLFRNTEAFATVSEVTVLRVKGAEPAYVAAFLAGKYGQSQIERYITGATGQLHLYPNDVDRVILPRLSESLQQKISELYERQWELFNSSLASHVKAQAALLDGLGIHDWRPQQPLTYTASAADALKARRVDAQYFRPLFREVQAQLKKTERAVALGSILQTNARGRQPLYADAGLPVINSKHVRTNRVLLSDNRRAVEEGTPLIIQEGDVLVNGTGVGTIGRAAAYLHAQYALPDNHVTVLRSRQIDPVYLAVFLNSPLGQWQIERQIRGSSGQVEIYPDDIARVVIWDAPVELQTAVRAAVLSAFAEERRSFALLRVASRAVEIAIDEGEMAAQTFIDAEGQVG